MVTSECSIGSQGDQSFCLPCGTQQSLRVCVPWCLSGGCSLNFVPISQCKKAEQFGLGIAVDYETTDAEQLFGTIVLVVDEPG